MTESVSDIPDMSLVKEYLFNYIRYLCKDSGRGGYNSICSCCGTFNTSYYTSMWKEAQYNNIIGIFFTFDTSPPKIPPEMESIVIPDKTGYFSLCWKEKD